MKWLLVLALLVACGLGARAWSTTRPDEHCPGRYGATSHAGLPFAATPEEALRDLTDDAAEVTREEDDGKGFQTVTFRGYDEDGELLTRVVVEGDEDAWSVARAEWCS